MGSDSDFPVVRKAAEALKEFGILFEMRVLSAHRSPKEVAEFAQNARANGFGVIIAAAGIDRKSTRLNSSHSRKSRMPSSA